LPPADGRGTPASRPVPQQQPTASPRDSTRPGVYSPKGYERAVESRPMVRSDSRQSAPSAAASQVRTGNWIGTMQ